MDELKKLIETAGFKSILGMYKKAEVDAFVSRLKKLLPTVEQEMEGLRQTKREYEAKEKSLAAALIAAENKSSEIIETARGEADAIMLDAKKQSDDTLQAMTEKKDSMEQEFKDRKNALVDEISGITSIKEKYQRSVQQSFMDALSKIMGMDDEKILEELPEEQRQKLMLKKSEYSINPEDFHKDLPESDEELKNMIKSLYE
jgi:cell division septum initiation protein DivIVA